MHINFSVCMVDEVVISEDYASCTAYTQTATNYPIVIHECHMLHGFEIRFLERRETSGRLLDPPPRHTYLQFGL